MQWVTKQSIHIPCTGRRDGSRVCVWEREREREREREIQATVVSHMTNIYSELKIRTVDIWPLCLLLSGSKISHNCSLKGAKRQDIMSVGATAWRLLIPKHLEGQELHVLLWKHHQGLPVQTLFHWPQKPHSPGALSLFTSKGIDKNGKHKCLGILITIYYIISMRHLSV